MRIARPLRAEASRAWPWIHRRRTAIARPPVYFLANSSGGAISRDGDQRQGERYLQRTLIAIAPDYKGPVRLQALSRDGRTPLFQYVDRRFDDEIKVDGDTVHEPPIHAYLRGKRPRPRLYIAGNKGSERWRVRELVISTLDPGCYAFSIRTERRTFRLSLDVPF